MGARLLREVVGARELLAVVAVLKGLVLRMQRTVVALEVLLAAEAAVADVADEGLGRVRRSRCCWPFPGSGTGTGSGRCLLVSRRRCSWVYTSPLAGACCGARP